METGGGINSQQKRRERKKTGVQKGINRNITKEPATPRRPAAKNDTFLGRRAREKIQEYIKNGLARNPGGVAKGQEGFSRRRIPVDWRRPKKGGKG